MQRWAAFYSLGSKMHGQAALRYLAVDIYTLFTVKITVIFYSVINVQSPVSF